MDEYKLIFIYNADSNFTSLVKDFWKKIFRPSSYECNLCMTTFGFFSVKKEWKLFINNLSINTEFLHRDEFEVRYNIQDAKYPSAYFYDNGKLTLFISQEEMNSIKTLDEMEALVLRKLNKFPYITKEIV